MQRRRMRRFRTLVVVLIVAGVAGGVHAAQQRTVTQRGKVFNVKELKVKAGELVVFKNDDNVTHHIYSSTKEHEFNLRVMNPGHDRQHTFTKTGALLVQCGLHPTMRLTVVVE